MSEGKCKMRKCGHRFDRNARVKTEGKENARLECRDPIYKISYDLT